MVLDEHLTDEGESEEASSAIHSAIRSNPARFLKVGGVGRLVVQRQQASRDNGGEIDISQKHNSAIASTPALIRTQRQCYHHRTQFMQQA